MQAHDTQLLKVDGKEVPENAFNQPVQTMTDAIPLMYQAGYLTIKDYDNLVKTYTLGIPNNEVRTGLMENILPMMSQTEASDNTTYSTGIIMSLRRGKYDEAMEYLRAFLTSIPHLQSGEKLPKDMERLEALYQNYMYVFCKRSLLRLPPFCIHPTFAPDSKTQCKWNTRHQIQIRFL